MVLTLATAASLMNALTVPVARIDRWLGRGWRAVVGETTGLVVPVFHAILPAGARTPDVDPGYALTLSQLAQVLEYFDRRAFVPVGLPQLQQPLEAGRNYVLFTFDDGYANNLAALDLLEAAGVPALVSVNTANTRSGEAFWWDVLYRELMASGASHARIASERGRLMEMEPADIHRELTSRFGADAFRARGEHDRPLTAGELRSLAGRPLISIGNHTADHRLLAGRGHDGLIDTLEMSQRDLEELTGVTPVAIAYPYGRYDDATLAACQSMDFQVGLTGEFGKFRCVDRVPDRTRMLQLPRCVIYGDRPIADQCENTHTDWKPSWMIRRMLRSSRGGERS
jgi:peptidoglycan/xylan/chitin deacetylase (PgdA/CDA1 family)